MVETMNNIGNRQPDSNAGCSKQKGVKNKQTRQLVLWIGALIVGAVLGIFGISWLDGLMNFIATVYTRLFQLLAVPTIAWQLSQPWHPWATRQIPVRYSATPSPTPCSRR